MTDTSDLLAGDPHFREEIRTWLDEHLVGEFAAHKGVGSPTDDSAWEVRIAWERELAAGGWLGISWPCEYGGRAATPLQEIIFAHEYASANAPALVNVQSLDLLGPSLIAHGTAEQKARFLPKILAVEEMWAQGWSEPGAGSDLASVQTRAVPDGDQWVINGQKVWTTFGHEADWLYVLARTNRDKPRHKGLTMFLVPVDQTGVDIRPIKNIAGRGEFCETFLMDATTTSDLVLGEVDSGWDVVMTTLGLERGAALLPQQLSFEREVNEVIDIALRIGALDDPELHQQLIDVWISVRLIKATNSRVVSGVIRDGTMGTEATIGKLFAATAHQRLGEIEMALTGSHGQVVGRDYDLDPLQKSFLLSRAETIYGGTAQIQRNIIGERVLGLPREP